jgi:hypothetical protein
MWGVSGIGMWDVSGIGMWDVSGIGMWGVSGIGMHVGCVWYRDVGCVPQASANHYGEYKRDCSAASFSRLLYIFSTYSPKGVSTKNNNSNVNKNTTSS